MTLRVKIKPWSYWRPSSSSEDVVELSSLHGVEVGLPAHFHDHDQLTFVLEGRRRFQLRDELLELGPGEGFVIPAGTPHCSFHEPAGAHCLNAYVAPGTSRAAALVGELTRHWWQCGETSEADLAELVQTYRQASSDRLPRLAPPERALRSERVADAAARACLSREGFSRRFRRTHGMSPHAFHLMAKLNCARELLRTGVPIAAAAADTGFADQSHLGRCFRRAFGVTPGAYRTG